MTYFTGDIHGDPKKIERFCKRFDLSKNDIIVILGDVGANYYDNSIDDETKRRLSVLGPTIFCVHGNHEIRPWNVKGYKLKAWNGGKVWVQDRYPNLLFAKDGEIFDIDGVRYIVIGGAYSVDKHYRLRARLGWWADEQPSNEIKIFVEKQLKKEKIDVVLSHTCPHKYEPTEKYLSFVNQTTIDKSTELWLDKIEENTEYTAWYCGHWHTDKVVEKIRFMFNGFDSDEWIRNKKHTDEGIVKALPDTKLESEDE